MEKEKLKKVAIVGAGIIGLYLAWKLSKAGHKVTVFEKKEKIGKKACSGLISERIKHFIPFDQSLIENKITFCRVYFPKKEIVLRFQPVHFAVNRENLAETLFNLCQKSGAKTLFSQPIKEIPPGFDKIIGCDGALSKIRRILNLPQPSFRLGLQFFLKNKDSSDSVEVWPIPHHFWITFGNFGTQGTRSKSGGGGFFWKIPRGNQIEYGALGSVNSISRDFEKFCKNQNIDFNESNLKSALIPQGLILPKNKPRSEISLLRGKNITLCGDSAGLCKPWSGGGIIWGLTAADILIKNFPDFERYHKEIKKIFGPQIFLGKLANFFVHFLGQNFSFPLPSKINYDNDFLKFP